MKPMKSALSLLLSAVLLLPLLAGCGGGKDPVPDGDPSGTAQAPDSTDTETEAPAGILDAVPELDFDGAPFRVLEQSLMQGYRSGEKEKVLSFWTEEESGEQVNDAIFSRNRAAEERFNVVIPEPRQGSANEVFSLASNSVLSGMDEFDLVFAELRKSYDAMLGDIFSNWNNVPYIDIDNPWYTSSIKDSAVNGVLLMIESDLCLSWSEQTWMIVFNKTKAEDYNLGVDLYQCVRDGKWTLDLLMQLTEHVYTDVNGDGKKSEEDFYGMLGLNDGPALAVFYYGCETPTVILNDDFTIDQPIKGEKFIDLMDKLVNLFNLNPGSYYASSQARDNRVLKFAAGNILFAEMLAMDLTDGAMRDFKDDFGVLPIPKWNEGQEEYHTMVNPSVLVMEILKTARNREMIGALVEAMSALSYQTVLPTYIDTSLEHRGVRDPESAEMLELVFASREADFAYVYDGGGGWIDRMPNITAQTGYADVAITYIEERLIKMEDTVYYPIIDYLLDYRE